MLNLRPPERRFAPDSGIYESGSFLVADAVTIGR
jgi:hypothetical protein